MDYTAERSPLSAMELIYDGCQEQSVDLDLTLPDYCPDIQRILKCQVYPRILDRSLAGDHLEISGTYQVKVFYLDADGGGVRCCESSAPFSASIPLKQHAEKGRVKAFARVEYINCRAASSRRLDVHGSFSICAKVFVCADCDAVSSLSGEDVEQRFLDVPYSRMSAFAVQLFQVEEVLELPGSKPEAETLLYSCAVPDLQDYKVIQNKLLIKGELNLHLLYLSAEGNSMETMEYAIPFSQMLDCEGITEEAQSDVRLSVVGTDVQIKNDYSGGKVFFDASVRLCADVTAYETKQTTVVSDAYSRRYEMALEVRQHMVEELTELFSDSLPTRAVFTMEQGISKVLDVWSESCVVSSAGQEEGNLILNGKYSICMLAIGTDGAPFYFERTPEFQYKRPLTEKETVRCDPDACLTGISYRLSANELEVKAEIALRGSVFTQKSFRMVEAAHADETKPREQDQNASLVLYYAEAGESLWDIARLYCTSMQAIQEENHLDCEKIEGKGMILIPMQAN